jgi:hypothetical protein
MMVLSSRSVASLAAVVALSLIAGAVAAARQTTPAGPAPFQGELVTVNVTAKTVTVKSADGASQQFVYNDATQISGAASNAEGLAAMKQARVTVHYMEDPKTKGRLATRIVAEGRG